MRRISPLLALPLVAALAMAAGARAHTATALGNEVAAAPARATAAELKAAQSAVDQALKTRKLRLEAWQKAQKVRDNAAADVARKKKAGVSGSVLEDALKSTLVLDEDVAHARSQLLAAESDVAGRGAALLKLYDALLVERRRAVEALPAQSSARAQTVSTYRDLAAQRDAVRQVLLPVLPGAIDTGAAADLPRGLDLDAHPDDDVEALLEKADLARDLEERFLRQAQAVRKRIAELEDEAAVARDVSGMARRSQLFDEEDRRLLARPAEANNTPAPQGSTSRNPPPAAPGAGLGAGDFNGAPEAQGAQDGVSGGTTTVPSSAFALTQGPSVVHSDQGLAAVPTDTSVAGLLSSSNVSVDALKALEAKLKARAGELSAKQKKLKAQAAQ